MTGYKSKVLMSAGMFHAPYIPKIKPTKFFIVDNMSSVPAGHVTIEVSPNVARWVEQQPLSMWKFEDTPTNSVMMNRYIVSEKLYTLLAVKWS